MERDLTSVESEVYELIKRSGEMMTTDVPSKMRGAISSLVSKGLVEVYKKRTSPWADKKRKFVKIKE